MDESREKGGGDGRNQNPVTIGFAASIMAGMKRLRHVVGAFHAHGGGEQFVQSFSQSVDRNVVRRFEIGHLIQRVNAGIGSARPIKRDALRDNFFNR